MDIFARVREEHWHVAVRRATVNQLLQGYEVANSYGIVILGWMK